MELFDDVANEEERSVKVNLTDWRQAEISASGCAGGTAEDFKDAGFRVSISPISYTDCIRGRRIVSPGIPKQNIERL